MTSDPTITPRNRLWTPWRMTYVGGAAREPGCVFCNRLEGDDDVGSLIVHRSRHAFVILNLYPYNTGHLMVVPNAHVQDPSQLDRETQGDMATLIGNLTGLLRRVLNCDGFNIGMNIGHAAGAGIAEHLHQHIVPRWVGDANFMPILGSTKVLPELLPATYGKIRAEIERDLLSATELRVLALVGDKPAIALGTSGLPIVGLERDVPIWQSVVSTLSEDLHGIDILGWAGDAGTRQDEGFVPVLAVRATGVRDDAARISALDDPRSWALSEDERTIVLRGLARFGW